MKPIVMILLGIAALAGLVWIGLQVKPKAFGLPALQPGELKTVPIPDGLPEPVKQFYEMKYGDAIPVIETVTLIGRGRIRPFGIWLPARFVMVHNAGKDYRHYFEATFFGLPFLKVNEGYIDGKSFFESPMGSYFDDPNSNQGANLALWAEGGWFPGLWVTDGRVRWEAVDATTALLYVPFEDQEESFVVRFDPNTRGISTMEAMRFKAPKDLQKVLWITTMTQDSSKPLVSYATWLDDGKPWAEFILDEMQFNLDVSEYIRARGQ